MKKVTSEDIKRAAFQVGVKDGDILLVHSSFKSLGEVEGGAESVIQGLLESVGKEGTLVLPTFCQKDFSKAYETWHIDKHSDTGYLTNYFRKREGSLRSDQATHSVAASGKKASWLTQTHGHTHKRFGSMGDTPFSADSPWEKMYQENAKVLLLGVSPVYITFRHYAEYVFIEECLKKLEGHEKYNEMKNKLLSFGKAFAMYPWPHINNKWIYEEMEKKGQTKSAICGNATILSVAAKDFVDFTLKCLRDGKKEMLTVFETTNNWIEWYEEFRDITESL